MRIKVILVAILALCSSSAFSKEAPKSLFNCLDLGKYTVDANCTSSSISASPKFQVLQKELSLKMRYQNPNAMATVQFHPEKMLIKVIAHKKLENNPKLIAAVRNDFAVIR